MRKITVLCAAGAALLAAPLFAQETPRANQPDPPIRANQDRDDNDRPDATQPRLLPGQPAARPAQPAQPGERVTAQKPKVEDTQETEFAQHVAACLILSNKAEIALTEHSMDKIQDPKVRELAEMIVKDHTQFVAKLKEHAPQAANLELDAHGAHASRDAAEIVRADQEPAASSTTNPAHGNASAAERSASETMADKALRIEKAYLENKLQMLNEKLDQEQGQNFEQAFLGCQVAGHVSMVAKLKALESEVHDPEVAQLIKQGQESAQKHLQHAEQLMQQEKDVETQDSGRSGAATDRAAPNRTQEGSTRPAPNRDR